MVTRKTSKSQLNLPKTVAGSFPGFDQFGASTDNNRTMLTPVKIVPIDPILEIIRKRMACFGIVERDVIEAIQWARN
ncbi:MAG: AbrB/MazE/SpoVT family DNA-binding domain-containing protein [Desulfuromonadaceae bacterium]|nr:AbrB/MazE/SpoVT family DNA-binding domain-containing protein [Desulfuromonadaceae bacterium]